MSAECGSSPRQCSAAGTVEIVYADTRKILILGTSKDRQTKGYVLFVTLVYIIINFIKEAENSHFTPTFVSVYFLVIIVGAIRSGGTVM